MDIGQGRLIFEGWKKWILWILKLTYLFHKCQNQLFILLWGRDVILNENAAFLFFNLNTKETISRHLLVKLCLCDSILFVRAPSAC